MNLWRRLKRRVVVPRTLPSVQAYSLWADSYPPYAHNGLMHIEQAAMLEAMPVLAQRIVLDLACGTGRYSRIAREAGATRVVGVDNSDAMLRASKQSARLAQATMGNLPFAAGSFDVIVCGLATGHLPPVLMRRAIAEMARVLRLGGDALISDFHPALYRSGGRRTFTSQDGTEYAVEHYPHTIEDYTAAIVNSGMRLTTVLEPTTKMRGAAIPAVLVLRCQRLPIPSPVPPAGQQRPASGGKGSQS